MLGWRGWMVLALLITAPMTAAVATVITDWEDKAVSTIQTETVTPPPPLFA